jgi:hypothetical protein
MKGERRPRVKPALRARGPAQVELAVREAEFCSRADPRASTKRDVGLIPHLRHEGASTLFVRELRQG